MGTVILCVCIIEELFFVVWSIVSKKNRRREKAVVNIGEFLIFSVLLMTGVLEWGFRYTGLFIFLFFVSLAGIIRLVRKKDTDYHPAGIIGRFFGKSIALFFVIFPAILCPQYKQPEVTGEYSVKNVEYTWEDESRVEYFTDTGENRKVTVQVWYPENCSEKTPLLIFSHGAFGFSGSNYSTCYDLASNGYTVASIGHTYHAFYTKDSSGKITIVDHDFLNNVMELNSADDPEKEFNDTREWLRLRTDDIEFVIDTIKALDGSEPAFANTDTEKIGLFGHSLGGAAAVQTAREYDGICAAANLDGTLLGERLSYENGKTVINTQPFDIPLLDIYGDYHYNGAAEMEKTEEYVNFAVERNSPDAYSVHFKNAEHLNFTDLPLFSPIMGKALGTMGTGSIDSMYCIETMNDLLVDFFDSKLKNEGDFAPQKEY